MRIESLQTNGYEATFRVVEDAPNGPWIVCAGGLGGTHLVWTTFIKALRDRYRIAVVDYPGLGDEQTLPRDLELSMTSLSELFERVFDAEGIESATLVGWSMGSQVAFECLRRFPDRIRGIVTVCGVAGLPFGVAPPPGLDPSQLAQGRAFPAVAALGSAMGFLADQVERIDTLRSVLGRLDRPTRWAKRLNLIDPAVDELIFDAIIRDYLALDWTTSRRYIELSAGHDATDMLPALPCPLLAIAGERDRFTTVDRVEQMTDRVEESELFVARGATHFLPIEYGELLAYKVDAFVSERTK